MHGELFYEKKLRRKIMKNQNKKSVFRGKVADNAIKTKTGGAQYGYLNLPKGVLIFAPEPGGRCQFDIMPYVVTSKYHADRSDEIGQAVVGEQWYKLPFKTHRNIGVENNAVVCPGSFSKKCPICEYRSAQMKEGADKEVTDALKKSNRNLYVVIPINHKKYEEVPHILDISTFLFQNLLTDELMENTEYEVFPDIEAGCTLRVRFDSETIGNSKPFASASRIDFVSRDYVYDESILEKIPSLDKILSVKSYKQLEREFFEMEEDDDEEDVTTMEEASRGIKVTVPAKEEKKDPQEEEKKDPQEEKEETPVTSMRSRRKEKSNNKCPYGYKFGVDTEKYDDCFDCNKWNLCIEEEGEDE